jgi:hypothetical protein
MTVSQFRDRTLDTFATKVVTYTIWGHKYVHYYRYFYFLFGRCISTSPVPDRVYPTGEDLYNNQYYYSTHTDNKTSL